MSRTKRIYNKPNLYDEIHGSFYHPWHQFCCGNCPTHKAGKIKEKRAQKLRKKEIIKESIYFL